MAPSPFRIRPGRSGINSVPPVERDVEPNLAGEREHARDRQADDIRVGPVDSGNKSRGQPLDRVAAGLVERLPGRDVPRHFVRAPAPEPHHRPFDAGEEPFVGSRRRRPSGRRACGPRDASASSYASAASCGLPSTVSPSRTTAVSAPMTSAPRWRAMAALVLRRATRSTYAPGDSPARRDFIRVDCIYLAGDAGGDEQFTTPRRSGGQDDPHDPRCYARFL